MSYPGYTVVAEVDRSDGCYQFDIVRVLREDGHFNALYWEQDSGCSCPCPFEDNTVEGLTRFTRRSKSWTYFEETACVAAGCPQEDIDKFVREVEKEFRKSK